MAITTVTGVTMSDSLVAEANENAAKIYGKMPGLLKRAEDVELKGGKPRSLDSISEGLRELEIEISHAAQRVEVSATQLFGAEPTTGLSQVDDSNPIGRIEEITNQIQNSFDAVKRLHRALDRMEQL